MGKRATRATVALAAALAVAATVFFAQRNASGPTASGATTDPSAASTWGLEPPPSSAPTYDTDIFTKEGFEERNRAARRQGKRFTGRVNGILIDPK